MFVDEFIIASSGIVFNTSRYDDTLTSTSFAPDREARTENPETVAVSGFLMFCMGDRLSL